MGSWYGKEWLGEGCVLVPCAGAGFSGVCLKERFVYCTLCTGGAGLVAGKLGQMAAAV